MYDSIYVRSLSLYVCISLSLYFCWSACIYSSHTTHECTFLPSSSILTTSTRFAWRRWFHQLASSSAGTVISFARRASESRSLLALYELCLKSKLHLCNKSPGPLWARASAPSADKRWQEGQRTWKHSSGGSLTKGTIDILVKQTKNCCKPLRKQTILHKNWLSWYLHHYSSH